MLAVIQDQQKLFAAQIIAQHVNDGALGFVAQANCNRSCAGEEKWVRNGSEFHEPRAIGIYIQ